jgi:predicted PurR-regulated permease PerM
MSGPEPVTPDPTADEPPRPAPEAAPTGAAAAPADPPLPPPLNDRPLLVAADAKWLRRALIMVVVAVLALQLISYAWGVLAGFLFNLLLAWLIAISVDPVVSALARRGMRRGLATTIVAVVSLLLIGGFLALFGGALATQVAELDWINRTFDTSIDPAELIASLNLTTDQVTEVGSSLAGGILGVVFGIVGAVFNFFMIVVFSFYFSADSPRIKRWIASLLKPERQVVFIQVWDISVQKAGGFVISKLALASISSFFHAGFFYLIDIPFWLPMGIFAGVVSQFIPTIGTYIGVALPALFAVFEEPIDVLWIVIFATVYQQIENYVLTPRISTRTMDINSGVALASVFVGAALFGPIGAIIGIPLAAIGIAIFEAYGQRYDIHPSVHRSADEHRD